MTYYYNGFLFADIVPRAKLFTRVNSRSRVPVHSTTAHEVLMRAKCFWSENAKSSEGMYLALGSRMK